MKRATKKGIERGTSRRRKLSTTISAESFGYLQGLVSSRRARNLAEAVDGALEQLRRAESRARLERETWAYFEGLSPEAAAKEETLEQALDSALDRIDFDV